jgi:hypothetical protein
MFCGSFWKDLKIQGRKGKEKRIEEKEKRKWKKGERKRENKK